MPDYGKILHRSIKIIKKNKWLIVYGFVLASLGAGGGLSSNANINLPSDFFQSRGLPKQIPQEIPAQTKQVLGVFTSGFGEWIRNISSLYWLFLILGIFIFLMLGIAIRMIATSWAKGSLIAGIQVAQKGQSVTLANTSPLGIATIKNLIIFGFIMLGLILCFLLIGVPILFLINLAPPPINTFLMVITIPAAILAFFFIMILFSMISIYAERLIVLKNYSPWEAWKKGLSLSKKGFLPTIVMGIINSILSFAIGCFSMIIIAAVSGFLVAFFLVVMGVGRENIFSAPTILAAVFILFVFANAFLILGAIINVFKYSNWNQLFDHLIGQETTPSDE